VTAKPLRFCFALHLHQPWGNFDSVFEQHLTEVYRPLLRALMDGGCTPIAMHLSGPLLEWLDRHAPDFNDEIGEHAAAGRLELLCAGHDEPILAVLPRQDRVEQIARHRDWIRRRFGADARGLWLTERVWEPALPQELSAAGVNFVLVDDRHFRVSGFAPEQLHRHFITEDAGRRVNVFPIDERLRYLIPFRPPAELAEYLLALREAGHPLAVLGDDGEKFGGWPGTRKWLYEDGWLADFLDTMRSLRDRGDVVFTRFGDAIESTPSGGLAYLPSASYREMEGWALPVEPARAYLRLEDAWRERLAGVEGGLLRGGHWRHFLVKYPEGNRMHKVMLALSQTCRERGEPPGARRAIGRAQCNDAYWHGVFGGIYLPFLRHHVWASLAEAERTLRAGETATIESRDLDDDGTAEFWLHSRDASVLVAPARGGLVEMWIDTERRVNLLDVIARHPEAYHRPLQPTDAVAASATLTADGAPSIHDLESQLEAPPAIDSEPRGLFLDRIVAGGIGRDEFIAGTVRAARSWATIPMGAEWRLDPTSATIHLEGGGLTKVIDIGAPDRPGSIRARWTWDPSWCPADSWFTTELSASAPLWITAPDAERWDYDIETVAKSERGFQRTVQGHATVLRWPASRAHADVEVLAGGDAATAAGRDATGGPAR